MLKKLCMHMCLVVTLFSFVGCTSSNDVITEDNIGQNLIGQPTLTEEVIASAKIVDISDTSVLICPTQESHSIYGLIFMSNENLPETARVGDIIDIYFDGFLLESYPAQINNTNKIEVVSNDNDVIGLLLEPMIELYNKNVEIHNIQSIGVNTKSIEEIFKNDKEAFMYMVDWKVDLENAFNVYERDEIEEHADNELLFDFNLNEITENGFIFDIQSTFNIGETTSIYSYQDCQAIFTDGYIKGNEVIS